MERYSILISMSCILLLSLVSVFAAFYPKKPNYGYDSWDKATIWTGGPIPFTIEEFLALYDHEIFIIDGKEYRIGLSDKWEEVLEKVHYEFKNN